VGTASTSTASTSTASTSTASTSTASTSTASSGPGYTRPGAVQIVCLAPGKIRKGQVTIAIATRAPLKVVEFRKVRAHLKAVEVVRFRTHGKPAALRIACPIRLVKPTPKACPPQVLRFDMAAGSSILTEVSGPMLTPPGQFSYHGSTYTIMSINPGADSFKVFVNNALFVNNGPAITGGIALMSCAG
jgi:hypothetical protein